MPKTTLIAASMVLAGSAFVSVAVGSAFVGHALADEVIIERAPAAEPPTSTTTIEKHGADCDSKTVHQENGAGDSKTVTRTNCD